VLGRERRAEEGRFNILRLRRGVARFTTDSVMLTRLSQIGVDMESQGIGKKGKN
jgi:hypothetical protein